MWVKGWWQSTEAMEFAEMSPDVQMWSQNLWIA